MLGSEHKLSEGIAWQRAVARFTILAIACYIAQHNGRNSTTFDLAPELTVVKGVFLQLRNEFEFPAKIIFTNISTGISVTAISYLW